jgi:hypothetical protein
MKHFVSRNYPIKIARTDVVVELLDSNHILITPLSFNEEKPPVNRKVVATRITTAYRLSAVGTLHIAHRYAEEQTLAVLHPVHIQYSLF